MITGILQARTGSSRLPGKILKELGDGSVLQHILKQVRASKRLEQLVLATSDVSQDDRLAEHARSSGMGVYRGDEQKMVSRLLEAAEAFGATIVVRLLGDCPLADPEIIDSFVDALVANPALDMVTNQHPHTYPDGYDISVLRIESLRRLCRHITASGRPESLAAIWEEGSTFKIANKTATDNYFMRYRLTLDYEKDLTVIRQVVAALHGEDKVLHLNDVLDYLAHNPDICKLNSEYIY